MNIKTFGLLVVVLSSVGCQNHKSQRQHPIIGTWLLDSVTWHSKEQSQHIEKAQPGMFIFDESHYSLMWSPKQSPRLPFTDLSKPTDDEILQGFRSIIFNAGAYQISANEIITTAIVAKVPGFENGQQFYRYQVENNKLILTMYDEKYPDGSKPDWSGQWETEFTLIKAKQ